MEYKSQVSFFSDYGTRRLSEILWVKVFPQLRGLGALLGKMRRDARFKGVNIRDAKELFFLDMVLTLLYVLPLILVAEILYQTAPDAFFLGGDRESYFLLAFFFGAPAMGVTFVMVFESARAFFLGLIRGGEGNMFSLGGRPYLILHTIFTAFVLCGFVVALSGFLGSDS
ncbi:hypothetical protein PWG71_27855 [Nocardiopsis sp. N85]|uniref:hypothetical protein n=1 Tax=Nocardiopsis sp. N85 TaxID=3029400 RepID=UPI00237EFB6B|nr:hypothetical protein [Nocardiopsis sp. N85]MDE3725213.1 hypothetical protein [Nocardiopsis sp. N85]